MILNYLINYISQSHTHYNYPLREYIDYSNLIYLNLLYILFFEII